MSRFESAETIRAMRVGGGLLRADRDRNVRQRLLGRRIGHVPYEHGEREYGESGPQLSTAAGERGA